MICHKCAGEEFGNIAMPVGLVKQCKNCGAFQLEGQKPLDIEDAVIVEEIIEPVVEEVVEAPKKPVKRGRKPKA